MSNVKELVGLEYETYSFEIEAGKIREFAAAIGDDNPIYYSLEAAQKEGFSNIPIPLTFLQVVDVWGGNSFEEKTKKLKLNPVKVLHGEQEYQFEKEIFAGDVITVNAMVTKAVTKKGSTGVMDLITIEHRYVNQDNELVAISKNVTVHRH